MPSGMLHLLDRAGCRSCRARNCASASPRIRPRPGYAQSVKAVSSIAVGERRQLAAALARGIERRHQAAGRGADDEVGRDAALLEHLDHADVGEAARRAAAERQADARRPWRGGAARRRRRTGGGAGRRGGAGGGASGSRPSRSAGAANRQERRRPAPAGPQPARTRCRPGTAHPVSAYRIEIRSNKYVFAPGYAVAYSPGPLQSDASTTALRAFWLPEPDSADSRSDACTATQNSTASSFTSAPPSSATSCERHLAGELADDDSGRCACRTAGTCSAMRRCCAWPCPTAS